MFEDKIKELVLNLEKELEKLELEKNNAIDNYNFGLKKLELEVGKAYENYDNCKEKLALKLEQIKELENLKALKMESKYEYNIEKNKLELSKMQLKEMEKVDTTSSIYSELQDKIRVCDEYLSLKKEELIAYGKKIKKLEKDITIENLAPVVEPEPVVESTPVIEPEPVVESTPVVEPEPVVESTPVVELEPVVESTPVTKKTIVIGEATSEELTSGLFLQALEEDLPSNKGKFIIFLKSLSGRVKREKLRKIYASYNPYYAEPSKNLKKKEELKSNNEVKVKYPKGPIDFSSEELKKDEKYKPKKLIKELKKNNPFDMINEEGKLIIK